MPHIGWANAVPDAKAKVDFEIGGVALAFTGPGYHDKVRNHIHTAILPTLISMCAELE